MSFRGLPAALLASAIGAAGLAGAAVAAAEPPLSGSYTFNSYYLGDLHDPYTRGWLLTPCGDGCSHVVASPTSDGRSGGYAGDLHLVDGRWQMTIHRPDGLICPDGRRMPSTDTFSLDPASLNGHKWFTGTDCMGEPRSVEHGFRLTVG